MKKIFSATTNLDAEYHVTVSFCGFINCDVYLVIDADKDADKDEILAVVIDNYADDLLEAEIVEEDDGAYEVEVTFGGQIGTSEIYSVWADNEADAIYEAIEEAKDDISIVEFHEL